MIVASPHIPVMGPSNTPCSEPPASTTNTSSEQLWYSESAWQTREAQAQAGKVSHAACPVLSSPETVGKVKLESMLWVRSCRRWGAGFVSHIWMETCQLYLERTVHANGVIHLTYFRCLPQDFWIKLQWIIWTSYFDFEGKSFNYMPYSSIFNIS